MPHRRQGGTRINPINRLRQAGLPLLVSVTEQFIAGTFNWNQIGECEAAFQVGVAVM